MYKVKHYVQNNVIKPIIKTTQLAG